MALTSHRQANTGQQAKLPRNSRQELAAHAKKA
jgi:hypothetical protein